MRRENLPGGAPRGSWQARSRHSLRPDGIQFRALLAASVKLDLRASRFRGAQRRLPPLFWALATYVFMGTMIAWGLTKTDDVFVFSMLTLSAAMFMTALTVVMEYSSVVVSPDDYGILAHRPISSRTYFWAKFANLLFYVSLTALAIGTPAALFGRVLTGAGPLFPLVYITVALAACIATGAFIVLIYSAAIRVFNYDKLTTAVSYIQAIATLLITLGYVFLPRVMANTNAPIVIDLNRWIYFAPSAWFAGVIQLSQTGGGENTVMLASIAAACTIGLLFASFRNMSLDYSRRISRLVAGSQQISETKTRRGAAVLWSRAGLRLCRSDEERVGFGLIERYMRRNRRLRMLVYPAFGLPLAIYAYGVMTGGFYDPFVRPRMEPDFPAQEVLGFYCVLLTVFFSTALVQSDQWKASWVFHAAPLRSRAALVVGARKVIIWRYIAPFFGLILLLLSFVMPPLHAAAFLAPTFVLAIVAFSLLSFAAPYLPLSQSIEGSRHARRLILIVLMTPALIASIILRDILWRFPLVSIPLVAVLAGVAFFLEKAFATMLERRLRRTEFLG